MNDNNSNPATDGQVNETVSREPLPTLDKHICYLLEAPDRVGANIRQQMIALRQLGAHVTACFMAGDPEAFEPEGDTDDVEGLRLPEEALSGTRFRAALALRKVLRERRFDLMVCDQYKAVTAAALATAIPFPGRPELYALLRGYFAVDSGSRRRIYRLMRKRLTGIIALTHAQKERLINLMPWYPAERIHVVHNYIDSESLRAKMLDPTAARKKLGIAMDAFVFGTIARFDPYKRITDLLHAFSLIKHHLPNGQLVIIGEGREGKALREEAHNLSITDQVLFTGYIPKASHYMKAFNVFVLPSEGDNFARVLLEAMAAEIPVLGVAAGGTPEVLGPQGLLVPPRKPSELSALMTNMVEMDARRLKHLGCRGFHWSRETFFGDRLAEQLRHVFDRDSSLKRVS